MGQGLRMKPFNMIEKFHKVLESTKISQKGLGFKKLLEGPQFTANIP